MAGNLHSTSRKLWQTLSSIKTGVILLILVVIISAAGTVILQRPATEADEMERAYSPQMLRLLDALKLTDVFHAWWFVLLLGLVSLSIVAASIQRFPNAWRFYARPYKTTDETFRKALPNQAQIPIENEEAGLAAAERALHKMHMQPGTHRRPEPLLAIRRAQPYLRDGGVHRPRQPAADFPRRHCRWLARLAWLPDAEPRGTVESGRIHTTPAFASCPSPFVATAPDKRTTPTAPRKVVVEPGGSGKRPRCSAANKSSSTIRWSITEFASISQATDRTATSTN